MGITLVLSLLTHEEAQISYFSHSIPYHTDPTVSIVQYDKEGSSYPIDLATFKVDLGAGVPANVANPFNMMFSSLNDYLGMESLTNKEVLKLSNNLLTDEKVWDNYFNKTGAWYKGAPQTACNSLACRRGEACLVACGFSDDAWQSCNSSSYEVATDVACRVEQTVSALRQSCFLLTCLVNNLSLGNIPFNFRFQ